MASDSERPTDPAPPWNEPTFVGDPLLYLIDRVSNLSDAVLAPEGVLSRRFESVMIVLKTIADSQLRIEAKVNELAEDHEKTKARLVLIKSNGNGAHHE